MAPQSTKNPRIHNEYEDFSYTRTRFGVQSIQPWESDILEVVRSLEPGLAAHMEQQRKHRHHQVAQRIGRQRVEAQSGAVDKAQCGQHIAHKGGQGGPVQLLIDDKHGHCAHQDTDQDGAGLGGRHAVPHHAGVNEHLMYLRGKVVDSGGKHLSPIISQAGGAGDLGIEVICHRGDHRHADCRVVLPVAVLKGLGHHDHGAPQEGDCAHGGGHQGAQEGEQAEDAGGPQHHAGDDGVADAGVRLLQARVAQPHSVGDNPAEEGRDHGADAVGKLGLPHVVGVAGGIGSLHVVHGLDKVVNLHRDDDCEVGNHNRKAVNHVLDAVGGVGEIEAHAAEIEGGAAQTHGIDHAAHNGHHQGRNLPGEQIAAEDAHHGYKEHRQTHQGVAEDIKEALGGHPDEADAGHGAQQGGPGDALLHPGADESAAELHKAADEAGRHRGGPGLHGVLHRVAQGHDDTVENDEHGRGGHAGGQGGHVGPPLLLRQLIAHPGVVEAAQHQADGHAGHHIAEHHLVRPAQHAGQGSDDDQIVDDIVGHGV